MEAIDIKNALDAIKNQVETKSTEQANEVKGLISALETKMKSETDVIVGELKADLKAIQDQADLLDVKLNASKTETKDMSYAENLAKSISENYNDIKVVSKGRNASLELKTVGDMTLATNLTGSAVKTYQSGAAMLPSQKINFADLVPTVNSATGLYVVYREGAGEGSIGSQTEGSAKNQRDYDFVETVFNATYIAGYTRYSKQMAQDLPFLTSFLPEALRRDYFKAENAAFFTALSTAATPSTTTASVKIEMLLDDLGTIENADFTPNGIVVNPKDWYAIAATKPSTYDLPEVVDFNNGNLTVNGVPVFKATWCPQDKYLIGDWFFAKKVVVDGLKVEFFEQDADNVTKNKITARIEQRTVLGIDQPSAFVFGDFGGSAI